MSDRRRRVPRRLGSKLLAGAAAPARAAAGLKPAAEAAASGALQSKFTGTAKGTVTLPASTTGTLNWQATEKLNLGTAVTYTEWSSYDALDIKVNGASISDETTKNWRDVWRVGLGAGYDVNETFTLMAGYAWDQDPINKKYADHLLPPGSRHLFNAGVAIKIAKDLELSIAYCHILMETEKLTIHGESVKVSGSNANIISSALAYKF